MKTLKKIPIFVVVFSIVFVSLSFSASALKDFVFSVTEPPVDNYHGYIVIPYYNPQLNFYQAELLYWVITPTVKTDNDTAPVATLDYQPLNNRFQLQFMTGQTDVSYTVAVYSIVGISANSTSTSGNTYCKGIEVISYDSAPIFSLSYGSSISFYNPIFQGVTFLDPDDYAPSSMGNASIIWGDDSAFYEEIYEANEKLTDLINSLDLTNEQLEETYALLSEYLSKIQTNTNQIKSQLVQLYDDFYAWTFTVDENHYRIIDLLEQLIEGTEDYTESPTLSDEQSELNRVEDELLNNEEASNAQNEIKVEINENAMSYIWGLITDFVSSNPKIFGLFISILSLGIIALILNR